MKSINLTGVFASISQKPPTKPYGNSENVTIPHRGNRASASLSFAQQRLWILERTEPGGAAYNESAAFRLAGDLNVRALEQSLDEIVRRHEALRTIFPTINGDPVQRILPTSVFSLSHDDLSDRPEREQVLSELLREEAKAPFDLIRGPLMRAKLMRLAPQQHVLFMNVHHIICDPWSMGVLFRDLAVLYGACCAGKPSPLPELPIQYTDYAVWQKQFLQDENLDAELSYWRKQLDDLSPLQLPTDRPRAPFQTVNATKQTEVLSKKLSEALKTLSRNEGVTLFMTLLAAFQTLLYRYTGQEDIAVGSPISGRNRAEIEEVVGWFVNTLVLRVDFSGNPTFRELLERVRWNCLGAYSHQDLPFEKLREKLLPERNRDRNPLFHATFQLDNGPSAVLQLPDMEVDVIELDSTVSKFDLSLSVVDDGSNIRAQFSYDTNLFDSTTIDRMISHFQNLLQSVVADPNQRVASLPILTHHERRQLLAQWNDTAKDYPANKCAHTLFEGQVRKTPEAIAVQFENQKVSYRELNNRANQVARYLRKNGVKQHSLVAIAMERSIEMAVGLLGILKAGAAYVPLDPAFPSERFAFILGDTKASVLLTQERFHEEKHLGCEFNREKAPLRDSAVKELCLDSDWVHIMRESQEDIETKTTTGDLAYVIYTSGSTGDPKGVMVDHRALVTHLLSITEHHELRSSDKVLQFASLSFDVATEELFPAWISGASVVLLPERAPTLIDFVDCLNRERISVVNLPSTYWHEWVDELDRLERQLPSSLRLLIVGNEKVSLGHFKRWHQTFGRRVRWFNAYGPTEATITATL